MLYNSLRSKSDQFYLYCPKSQFHSLDGLNNLYSEWRPLTLDSSEEKRSMLRKNIPFNRRKKKKMETNLRKSHNRITDRLSDANYSISTVCGSCRQLSRPRHCQMVSEPHDFLSILVTWKNVLSMWPACVIYLFLSPKVDCVGKLITTTPFINLTNVLLWPQSTFILISISIIV